MKQKSKQQISKLKKDEETDTSTPIPVIGFRTVVDSCVTELTLTGKLARILRKLILAGSRGLTQYDVYLITTRLAGFVHVLRTKHKLEIDTARMPHSGGTHGLYVLRTQVSIIENE